MNWNTLLRTTPRFASRWKISLRLAKIIRSVWYHLLPICHSFESYQPLLSWLANLVLQDTVERIYFVHDKKYSELPHGVFLIRGENVVFLGESVRRRLYSWMRSTRTQSHQCMQDIESENQLLSSWTKIDFKEAKAIVKNESESKQKIKNAQVKILHSKGFSEDLIQY